MIKIISASILFSILASISAQAQTATTIIPYLDTEYKFKIVSSGQDAGFEQPDFDDTYFSIGNGGFGSSVDGYCPLNTPSYTGTMWATYSDILLRKPFDLPAGTANVKVGVAIDNDVQVFINGHDISGGVQYHEGCAAQDSFIFTVPDGILNVGTNILAVRGIDRGVVSYLDVQVTADIPEQLDVPVDIHPQSCPNPVNITSKGVLPVAILGTASFDVAAIDLASIRLLDAAPIRSAVEDVSTPFQPFTGKQSKSDCTEDGPDGFLDLTLKFDTQSIIQAIKATLGRDPQDGEALKLPLEGKLSDNTPIAGEDVVVMLNKGKTLNVTTYGKKENPFEPITTTSSLPLKGR